MLKRILSPKLLSGLFVATISVGSVAFASIDPILQELLDADKPATEQADDVIPMEELADQAASQPEDADLEDIRGITQKEKATFKDKRVQIIVYKTMKGDTGRQHMDVMVDGQLYYQFTVSTAFERRVTGKSGRTYFSSTPNGQFVPDTLESKRYSNLWKVWLKYVITFSGGVWIHATTPDHYAELGAPASGGCVRLHEDDAEQLFKLVSSYGKSEVGITIIPAPGEAQKKPKKAPGRLVQ